MPRSVGSCSTSKAPCFHVRELCPSLIYQTSSKAVSCTTEPPCNGEPPQVAQGCHQVLLLVTAALTCRLEIGHMTSIKCD